MARNHLNDLDKLAYCGAFEAWESLALTKNARQTEYKTRARMASVMRDLRENRPLELDAEAVLGEARQLVADATKAYNAVEVYQTHEVQTLLRNVEAEYSLTRLLLWSRNVRRLTEARYARYVQQQGRLKDQYAYDSEAA